MGFYHTAQVCINGHYITDRADESPELRADYCSKCGAETIMRCQNCNNPIRGDYEVLGVCVLGRVFDPPLFCNACGQAFPWTTAKIQAAQELTDELDELNDEEKDILKDNIPRISADSPMSEPAAVRIGKVLKNISSPVGAMLQKLIVEIASETAKKAMGL